MPVAAQNRWPSRKSRLPCMSAQATPASVNLRSAATIGCEARIVVVVADPGLEQVAEDVELARGARAARP